MQNGMRSAVDGGQWTVGGRWVGGVVRDTWSGTLARRCVPTNATKYGGFVTDGCRDALLVPSCQSGGAYSLASNA